MKKHYTIIVARPTSKADPIFMKDEEGYLFPRIITKYQHLGIIDDYTVSMPNHIPEEYQKIFQEWGLECSYSAYDKPQLRLKEITQETDAQSFLLLTPYSYLLDKNMVLKTLQTLESSPISMCTFEGFSTSSSFVSCDRVAINALAQLKEFVITPFSMHKYAASELGEPHVRQEPLPDNSAALVLLAKALYHGKDGILPNDFVSKYFKETPEESLFTHDSFIQHTTRYFNIKDYYAFSDEIGSDITLSEIEQRAAQILFLSRIKPLFPKQRKRFVEVGYGSAPITSMFMLNEFDSGIAIEPFRDTSVNWSFTEAVSKNIKTLFGVDFSRTSDCSKLTDNLVISDQLIEDISIEEESVDFIFSKTVFEHVMDVESVSASMYKILRKGGKMFHVIDHQDHLDCNTIRFDFLKYDRESWREMQNHTNLWRVNDFVEYWAAMGFKVDVINQDSRIVELAEIHPSWEKYRDEDLFCYHSAILAEKL